MTSLEPLFAGVLHFFSKEMVIPHYKTVLWERSRRRVTTTFESLHLISKYACQISPHPWQSLYTWTLELALITCTNLKDVDEQVQNLATYVPFRYMDWADNFEKPNFPWSSKSGGRIYISHFHPMVKSPLLNERPVKEVPIICDKDVRLHFLHMWEPSD